MVYRGVYALRSQVISVHITLWHPAGGISVTIVYLIMTHEILYW